MKVMKRLALSLTVLALAAAACTSSGTGPQGTAQPVASRSTGASASAKAPLPSPSPLPVDTNADPVVQVVRRALPAVVNVTTNLLEQSPFGGSQPGRGVGTGFIVRSDGIVVTNFHVVEGAQRITVTTSTTPTRTFLARVIGGDAQADLAVLKIHATGLPAVPLGNSGDLALGERVVAMGYALALNGGPSVTSGIVSSLNREVKAADPNFEGGTRTYTHAIQTDAAINPGNSGGPLLNLAGQVVGINTAGAQQAENIGFAIAIDAAKPTIEHAIENPSAPVPFLGVTTTSVTSLLQAQQGLTVDHGAFVIEVAPKGPAQRAGIRPGDVIVSFDGSSVQTSDDLGTLIQKRSPGDSARVGVIHTSGNTQTYTIILGVRPLPNATPSP
jgi:S1-C subfamily serine protease